MAPTGLTKDGTWQLGVRRTFAGWSLQDAWDAGLELVEADPAADPPTSRTDLVVARFPYGRPGWPTGVIQLRSTTAARGATVAIAIQGLPDEATRIELLARWTAAVEGLAED